MPKKEIMEIPFTVKIDERKRAQIPHDVAQTAKLQDGDSVTLVLKQVIHREG